MRVISGPTELYEYMQTIKITELVTPCVGTNSYSSLLKVRQRGKKTELTGRRRKRRKQLMDGLKEKKGTEN